MKKTRIFFCMIVVISLHSAETSKATTLWQNIKKTPQAITQKISELTSSAQLEKALVPIKDLKELVESVSAAEQLISQAQAAYFTYSLDMRLPETTMTQQAFFRMKLVQFNKQLIEELQQLKKNMHHISMLKKGSQNALSREILEYAQKSLSTLIKQAQILIEKNKKIIDTLNKTIIAPSIPARESKKETEIAPAQSPVKQPETAQDETVLSQIQKGIPLRHVEPAERPQYKPEPTAQDIATQQLIARIESIRKDVQTDDENEPEEQEWE